jgi:SDR family mycofactocin-dependent oxidoreductase
MSGRVRGKVALVTGAARGIGRAHAVRLAQEGADIVAIDLAGQIGSVRYAMASLADLKETARQVEGLGRRIVARQADVRDFGRLRAAVDEGVATLGRLDIAVACAGIATVGTCVDLSEDEWRDVIDVNLTGVWHTAKAAVAHIRSGGRGGSVILISSAAALKSATHLASYSAAKQGVLALTRTLAVELAPESIRVNAICPGSANTDMIHNPALYGLWAHDLPEEQRTLDAIRPRFESGNALPVPWVEPEDIANAALFLASDEARYITGVTVPVDAGTLLK